MDYVIVESSLNIDINIGVGDDIIPDNTVNI